jgi:hypothetical protein
MRFARIRDQGSGIRDQGSGNNGFRRGMQVSANITERLRGDEEILSNSASLFCSRRAGMEAGRRRVMSCRKSDFRDRRERCCQVFRAGEGKSSLDQRSIPVVAGFPSPKEANLDESGGEGVRESGFSSRQNSKSDFSCIFFAKRLITVLFWVFSPQLLRAIFGCNVFRTPFSAKAR